MRIKKYRYFVADFETTVYDGQVHTEVWAAAIVELYSEDVHIFHSIGELFQWLKDLDDHCIVYFHNLKFDGSFWLSYLLLDEEYEQAYKQIGPKVNEVEWLKETYMPNDSFKYAISDKGQWYSMVIKHNHKYIELRDSLKLLPFSVEKIGKDFKTKHRKLSMDYTGFRYAGCIITPEEREYIANDVLVVKEALEMMFDDGHNALTIGACCLKEYKNICKTSLKMPAEYDTIFPNLYEKKMPGFGFDNVGDYIRKSYRGGWCYVVRGKENRIYHNGTTADVNSLYPSMMHSESGNRYPIGMPIFWKGNKIPNEALDQEHYFFIRIKTRFYLKKGMLPFIQIKSSFLYDGTEMLESSDVMDHRTGESFTHYIGSDGEMTDTRVELTLTETDFRLLKDHYDLIDFEILDGCWFRTAIGIFDDYIDKYKKIKMESEGAKRVEAKLFLNNLYGKMAASTDSSFKIARVKPDQSIGFLPVFEHNKKPGYIPVGSAITSYARDFTIRAAQKNYHGVDQPGFIYADTDSIHCDLLPEDLEGIRVDRVNFCCWDLESCWDTAYFTRQKTYIEHITHEHCVKIDNPYNNIKCAGMPQRCKDLFELSLTGNADPLGDYTPEQKEFLFKDGKAIKRSFRDFNIGLKIPGKLMPKRIRGGILLKDTTYEMR